MGTLSLRLPESLHRHLAEVAAREGVSINQLISSAVAEKMSALLTEEYLEGRAKRAARSKFTKALASIPDVDAAPSDRWEAKAPRGTEPSVARDKPARPRGGKRTRR